MSPLELKPTHEPIQNLDSARRQVDEPGASYEGPVKSARHSLSASIPLSESDGQNMPLAHRLGEGRRRPGEGHATGRMRCSRESGQRAGVRCRSHALARPSINPNLADATVEEMLTQHSLTERLLRPVFNNPDIARRNIMGAKIGEVVDALASQRFSRTEFRKKLDRFYLPIVHRPTRPLPRTRPLQTRCPNRVEQEDVSGHPSGTGANTEGIR